MRRSGVLALLLIASACANLDGLADGAGDAGVVPLDAGSNASDANGDASIDRIADVIDATSDVDAGPIVEQPPSFCSGQFEYPVLFCTTLDSNKPADGFMTSPLGSPNTGYEKTSEGVRFFSATGGGSVYFSRQIKDLAPKAIALSAKVVSISQAGGSETYQFLGFSLPWGDAGAPYEVSLRLTSTGAVQLYERSTFGNESFSQVPEVVRPKGERWEILMQRDTGSWGLAVRVDGQFIYFEKAKYLPMTTLPNVSGRIGVWNAAGTCNVTFDDVAIIGN